MSGQTSLGGGRGATVLPAHDERTLLSARINELWTHLRVHTINRDSVINPWVLNAAELSALRAWVTAAEAAVARLSP